MAATFLPDSQPNTRRTIAGIAAGTLLALTGIVGYAAGRADGYGDGKADTIRSCEQGIDQTMVGRIGSGLASIVAAPDGQRAVACTFPAEDLDN